jgi:hypothetical protein
MLFPPPQRKERLRGSLASYIRLESIVCAIAIKESTLFLEWQNFSVEEYEKTRAQNVPKTKVDDSKLVEIAQVRKKSS